MRVAVVGAGIVGACTAWALARKGVACTLFDRRQPMCETSRASSKLLHGGLRYLESGQFRLVGKALHARTDWLALAVRLGQADRDRLAPDRILWMSPKRKRLDWQTATSPGFYLYPLPDYHALKDRLGAPPTTGAMMIDLIAKSDAARLDLYGFDFFASLSLSGRRSAEQVPHDFGAEAAWADALIRQDARLRLNP